jgi:hypothetical protein
LCATARKSLAIAGSGALSTRINRLSSKLICVIPYT